MHKDLERILVSKQELEKRIAELARDINNDYRGKEPIFLGVLKGSVIFLSDLVRSVDLDCTMDFIGLSSYGNASATSGSVRITKDIEKDVEQRDIIIVEDILDSGYTMSYLVDYLKSKAPSSIRICVLLDKPARRKTEVHSDYFGFEVPDDFVVGYGLDYAERYKNLPYIGVLKPEIYNDKKEVDVN